MNDNDIISALANKADIQDVRNLLLVKADKAYTMRQLGEKADIAPVAASLATKVNNDTFTAAQTTKANKAEVFTRAEVLALLDRITSAITVKDLTERDALTDFTSFVWVLDATGDPDGYTGAILYRYAISDDIGGWVKLASADNLTGIIHWADVLGIPTSSAAELDDAVTKAHEHSNSELLQALTLADGKVVYEGRTLAYIDIDRELPSVLDPDECILDFGLSAYWKVLPTLAAITPELARWVDGAKGILQVFNGDGLVTFSGDWQVVGEIPTLQTDGFDVFEIQQLNDIGNAPIIFIKHIQAYTNPI